MSSPDQEALQYGATVTAEGVSFRVHAPDAQSVTLCLFEGDEESKWPMSRDGDDFSVFVGGLKPGARYGLRADGPWKPDEGHWFDPSKLLVDPYATRLDSRYQWDPDLALPRKEAEDTAPLVPKAIVEQLPSVVIETPIFQPGGMIYEVNVRGLTRLHRDIPKSQRGTIAALAHPALIAHYKKIGVSALELMPITAWIDERHLPPLGLSNAWGYNPVTFMALDPMLAPGGMAELAATVQTLRNEGIGVILDLVFNHTGESDDDGATLSMRGLMSRRAFRHIDIGDRLVLANDAGTGNTIACDRPAMRRLIVDSLRHFVRHAGVDGFRFDLAPILGRTPTGFHNTAETLKAIETDPLLKDRILIAEPWDVGPGGYQLGGFSPRWLEWNDRYRDDMRMFWRGDDGKLPAFAHGFAGSSDIFHGSHTRTVNFLAAHDGFTLMDMVSNEHKHNEANGEDNRDGHSDNHSWNNGVEGRSDNSEIVAARRADIIAMLSTLFLSRGSFMLTAGDEFGRTQKGNNNAYAQDNELTWVDWSKRDVTIEDHVAALAAIRNRFPALRETTFFSGEKPGGWPHRDIVWLTSTGREMEPHDWHGPDLETLQILIASPPDERGRLAILVNRGWNAETFLLPAGQWKAIVDTTKHRKKVPVSPRSVTILEEITHASG